MNPNTEVFQGGCHSFSYSFYQKPPVRPPLRPLWKTEIPGTVDSVVVFGSLVIAGCGRAGVVALDILSGGLRWQSPNRLRRSESCPNWIGPDYILVRDDARQLWTLGWSDGKPVSLAPELKLLKGFHRGAPVFYSRAAEGSDMSSGMVCLGGAEPAQRWLGLWGNQPGERFWYGCPPGAEPDPTRVSAVDLDTLNCVWTRSLGDECVVRSVDSKWVQVGSTGGMEETTRLFMLDAETGCTAWSAEMPPSPRGRTIPLVPGLQLINPQLNIMLVTDTRSMEVYWGEIRSGKKLWANPIALAAPNRLSLAMCWTGDILWGAEVKRDLIGKYWEDGHPEPKEWETVAYEGLTGRELWRGPPLHRFIPYDGRLYSWHGRTVTCWVSEHETGVSVPDAANRVRSFPEDPSADAESTTAKPAKAKKKGATRKAGTAGLKGRSYSHLDAPEPQSDWREWDLMETEEDGPEPVTVSALLDGLGKVFPNVELLADATIVITDAQDQHWGTLKIAPHHQAHRRAKKVTAQSEITGCSTFADPVVDEVLGLLLEKLGVNWEWGN